MGKRKTILWMAMIIIGIFALSACSAGENGGTERRESGQKKESSAGLSQFAEEKGETWQDSWSEETASGSTVRVNVLAETVVPDLKQMSTVEVCPYEFNEENRKKLADALFDSGWERTEKKYYGTRDGIEYELDAADVDEKGSNIFFSAKERKDIYPERVKGKGDFYYWPVEEENGSENECKLTKEEADKIARALLQKTGFSDLIQIDAKVLQWEEHANDENGEPLDLGESAEQFNDGWYFTYGQGADGVAFNEFAVHREPIHGDDEEVTTEGYSEDCLIRVFITDRGVIEVDFGSLLEIHSITPGVKLLPLDEIKKIMKSEIKQLAEFNVTKRKKYTMKFEFLELVYYRVTDPENANQFTYIPAWRLRDHMGYEPPFVVNAMDGSVVNDWEETWKIVKDKEQ